MNTNRKIKAITFDTGGTILDWHTGFLNAFKKVGEKYGYNKDWASLTNKLRKCSLIKVTNLGEVDPPAFNIDNAHLACLEKIILDEDLGKFTEEDKEFITKTVPYSFKCWDDFPATLPKIRENFIVCSFTVLSYRMVIETSRKNGLSWDAIFSCEGIQKYKLLPDSYKTVSKYLQLDPSEIMMVACHPLDLNAAEKVGFNTALVRRNNEWGGEDPHKVAEIKNDRYTIDVNSFPDLLKKLDNFR